MASLIQIAGAVLILIAYMAAQAKRLDQNSLTYLVLNVTGSGMLAYLAFGERQLGFLLLQGIWVAMTTISIAVYYRRRWLYRMPATACHVRWDTFADAEALPAEHREHGEHRDPEPRLRSRPVRDDQPEPGVSGRPGSAPPHLEPAASEHLLSCATTPATAARLASRSGLSPDLTRRHLTVLWYAGLIAAARLPNGPHYVATSAGIEFLSTKITRIDRLPQPDGPMVLPPTATPRTRAHLETPVRAAPGPVTSAVPARPPRRSA
ncbi:CBU_0592 family membrane protein [Actinocorallia longicatena]|uniref:CBU-0592-like domain-containing protein n=1 Tax=Actinocorallia longicatena TaxID=111803 RepID=A0ABP6Q0I6_9ACTN